MKIIKYILIFLLFSQSSFSDNLNNEFESWKLSFKARALKNDISENTINSIISDLKFLPKVIEYDRYQPEFYEDTKTYIGKRTSENKLQNGIKIYKSNKDEINKIDKNFSVEKELLLSLMGIETNFGKYLGKMDILSSLATLSFDKRRSEFFTNELLILLKLIDDGIIDQNILYGSWAGAFGNFQFMPSTIKNYAIDYNLNESIELKNTTESFASAANYIQKLGWKKNGPCFKKILLNENIPNKYLNTSAKKIKNKKKLIFFKKYIQNYDDLNILDERVIVGIITPDKDIIPGSETLNPAFIVFNNYELILKWNRSLRFALAVCTLKEKFENEL